MSPANTPSSRERETIGLLADDIRREQATLRQLRKTYHANVLERCLSSLGQSDTPNPFTHDELLAEMEGIRNTNPEVVGQLFWTVMVQTRWYLKAFGSLAS